MQNSKRNDKNREYREVWLVKFDTSENGDLTPKCMIVSKLPVSSQQLPIAIRNFLKRNEPAKIDLKQLAKECQKYEKTMFINEVKNAQKKALGSEPLFIDRSE